METTGGSPANGGVRRHKFTQGLCEHAFVGNSGHPHARLQRALDREDLPGAHAAAVDLGRVPLADAFRLLLLIEKKAGGVQNVLLKGTLTRTVAAEGNTQGADIRRITFKLTYTFQRRNFTVEMTGLRSIDD